MAESTASPARRTADSLILDAIEAYRDGGLLGLAERDVRFAVADWRAIGRHLVALGCPRLTRKLDAISRLSAFVRDCVLGVPVAFPAPDPLPPLSGGSPEAASVPTAPTRPDGAEGGHPAPAGRSGAIPAPLLADRLGRVLHCAGRPTEPHARFALASVRVEFGPGRLRFTSTDGRRIASQDLPTGADDDDRQTRLIGIKDARAIVAGLRRAGKRAVASIRPTADGLAIEAGSFRGEWARVAGRYPDHQFRGEARGEAATVPVAALSAAVAAAPRRGGDGNQAVRIAIRPGSLAVGTVAGPADQDHPIPAARVRCDGAGRHVHLNGAFLAELCRALGGLGDVAIRIEGWRVPVAIDGPDGFRCDLMPLTEDTWEGPDPLSTIAEPEPTPEPATPTVEIKGAAYTIEATDDAVKLTRLASGETHTVTRDGCSCPSASYRGHCKHQDHVASAGLLPTPRPTPDADAILAARTPWAELTRDEHLSVSRRLRGLFARDDFRGCRTPAGRHAAALAALDFEARHDHWTARALTSDAIYFLRGGANDIPRELFREAGPWRQGLIRAMLDDYGAPLATPFGQTDPLSRWLHFCETCVAGLPASRGESRCPAAKPFGSNGHDEPGAS